MVVVDGRSLLSFMEFWRQFENELLARQFRLDKYAGPYESGAIFRARTSGTPQREVEVKVVAATSRRAKRRASSWKLATELRHPNLLQVYETGSATLGGLRVVYAVMDRADDTLDKLLQERCLTQPEARELLLSSAQALSFLHARGIVHTRLEPREIIALDNLTKLSVDRLKVIDQRPGTPAISAADDIAALGAVLCKAITGTVGFSSSLPVPLRNILRHCLQPDAKDRWAASDIVTALNVVSSEVRDPAGFGSQIRRLATWKSAAVAAGLAACALWLGFPTKHRSDSSHPPHALAQVAPFGERARLRESETNAPATELPGSQITARDLREVWRVVVFQDSNVANANRRADAINEIWPDLNAAVYSLTGDPPFEVIVGATMERATARRLVKRLRSNGLPEAMLAKTAPPVPQTDE